MQHEMQHEISEDDTAPAHHRGIYTFKIPDHSNARRDYNISVLSPDYDFKSNLSSNSAIFLNIILTFLYFSLDFVATLWYYVVTINQTKSGR